MHQSSILDLISLQLQILQDKSSIGKLSTARLLKKLMPSTTHNLKPSARNKLATTVTNTNSPTNILARSAAISSAKHFGPRASTSKNGLKSNSNHLDYDLKSTVKSSKHNLDTNANKPSRTDLKSHAHQSKKELESKAEHDLDSNSNPSKNYLDSNAKASKKDLESTAASSINELAPTSTHSSSLLTILALTTTTSPNIFVPVATSVISQVQNPQQLQLHQQHQQIFWCQL